MALHSWSPGDKVNAADLNANFTENLDDIKSAHHQKGGYTKIVNADVADAAAIVLTKLAALTVNRALITNASGFIIVSAVTATELGYLDGIASKPVANSGNETIAGKKTFSTLPEGDGDVPTTANQLTPKSYVDIKGLYAPNSVAFGAAAAPAVWTDLDLNSIVGSNTALVLLKVFKNHSGAQTFAFRKNGDTDDFYGVPATDTHTGIYRSASTGALTAGYVTVITDSSGVIEWISDGTGSAIITVEAYHKV